MRLVLMIFLSGLLIKFILMPFAMHSDLLSMYFRAHLMSEYGLWNLPTNQYLAHLIYALNLKLMSLVGFDISSLFELPFGLRSGSTTSSVGDWLKFAEHSQINAVLFWFKLPHLIIDSFVFVILYKYFQKNKHLSLILSSWWLNPVNIYAFYIFSRHDVFTLLALLLAVVFAARNQLAASIISVFAAIQIRVQPILLLPIFAISWWKGKENFRKFLEALICSAALISAYFLIKSSLPFDSEIYNDLVGINQLASTPSLPSPLGIPVRHASQVLETQVLGIPVYLVVYAAVAAFYLFLKKLPRTEKSKMETLNSILLIIMALYFAINPFSPHYFVWLSIFLTLAVSYKPRVLIGYGIAVIGWTMVSIFSQDLTWFSQNLLVPISTDLFRTPQLGQLIQERLSSIGISTELMQIISKLILALGLIYVCYEVINKHLRGWIDHKKTPRLILVILLTVSLFAPLKVEAAPMPVLKSTDFTNKIPLEEKPIGQTFEATTDTFGTIEVRLTSERVKGAEKFVFRIKEVDSDDWLYENFYEREDLYDKYFYPFGFPLITNAKGKSYYFELVRPQYNGSPVFVYINDNNPVVSGQSFMAGSPQENLDLSFNVIAEESSSTIISYFHEELVRKFHAQSSFFSAYLMLIVLITLGLVAILAGLILQKK